MAIEQRVWKWWLRIRPMAALCAALAPLVGFAANTIVSTEPTENPIARFVTEGKVTTIGWYFLSDAPRKERKVAQTVQVDRDGVAKHFAVRLQRQALVGLGQDAIYELIVYESAKRPDRSFVNRKIMLKQEGLIQDGEGGWLIFPLSEELPLKTSHFYTFSLHFTIPSSGNRVVFTHSEGDVNTQFRWHRSGRESWTPSPLSLHYVIY